MLSQRTRQYTLENNLVKEVTWISMIKTNMLEVYTTEFDTLDPIKEQFSGLALVEQRYNLLKSYFTFRWLALVSSIDVPYVFFSGPGGCGIVNYKPLYLW